MSEISSYRQKINARISSAVSLAETHGTAKGARHKMWVIDQMVRTLLGDGYADFVLRNGGEWDEGTPP